MDEAPDVKAGDIWMVGDQAYFAQSGNSGILLIPVLLPSQLSKDAVLVSRSESQR